MWAVNQCVRGGAEGVRELCKVRKEKETKRERERERKAKGGQVAEQDRKSAKKYETK